MEELGVPIQGPVRCREGDSDLVATGASSDGDDDVLVADGHVDGTAVECDGANATAWTCKVEQDWTGGALPHELDPHGSRDWTARIGWHFDVEDVADVGKGADSLLGK
jgi:hypothetical protein